MSKEYQAKIRQVLNALRRKQNERQPGEPELTERQAKILATGLQLHAEGIPWWHAIQLIEAMQERKYLNKGGFGRAPIYVDLAKLQGRGLVQARWGVAEEKPEQPRRYFRVTDEGRRERSKVKIKGKSALRSTVPIPQPKPR